MDDNEMLSRCLDCFEAMEKTTPPRLRKFIQNSLGFFPRSTAGQKYLNRRAAQLMAITLRRHLHMI